MNSNGLNSRRIPLYLSPEHPCSYLSGKQARTLFVDPHVPLNSGHYEQLLAQGFRRSGDLVYRPQCNNCDRCIPIRIPCSRFHPRRIQRRILKRWHDARIVQQRARFDEAHYQLYCRYIEARHPDGGMASPTENQYRDFLISHWCDTRFVEFHLEERLLAIAVTDRLPHGLSALYTFFDPDASELSPGVYAILWQISEAARLTLPWLYLGYWIPECKKMRYKAQYRPLQLLRNGSWHEYGPDGNIP